MKSTLGERNGDKKRHSAWGEALDSTSLVMLHYTIYSSKKYMEIVGL